MYNRFIIELKSLRQKPKYENKAVVFENLENLSIELINKCDALISRNPENGKSYCSESLYEIDDEKLFFIKQEGAIFKQISNILKTEYKMGISELLKKRNKPRLSLTQAEQKKYKKLQQQMDDIGEVLNICNYTETALIDILNKYSPEINSDPKFIEIINYVLPPYDGQRKRTEEYFSKNKIKENEIPLLQQTGTKIEKQSPVIKPVFNPEAIDRIFDIIKQHFPDQQKELLIVLKTGDLSKQKLLFHGNGKTLLDFFKQLMRGQFLTISIQRRLEIWISAGFEYLHQGKPNEIKQKYASRIISGNERAAKGNRLIDVKKKGGLLIIEQLEIKNRENG